MTLSDLEWLNEIFNDTKHRAVSLRQLSFLFKRGKWEPYCFCFIFVLTNCCVIFGTQFGFGSSMLKQLLKPKFTWDLVTIFCRAMLCKRGLSRHAVSVCPSVTFVHYIKTNKYIFKFFSPSGSQTILLFPYQTSWQYFEWDPLKGASNAGEYEKSRFSTNFFLYLGNDAR